MLVKVAKTSRIGIPTESNETIVARGIAAKTTNSEQQRSSNERSWQYTRFSTKRSRRCANGVTRLKEVDMHNKTKNDGKGHAKDQDSSNRDSEDVEAREALDVNRVESVLGESDNAVDWDPAGASTPRRRGGKASRGQSMPMSPGGSANQRVAEPDDK